jgi:CRISPR-associated endonuclease Cas1
MFGENCMNETALLINSPFSLTQKNNVPIYTQLGETIIRPYNDDEIRDQLQSQMTRDKKAGIDKETTFKKCKYLETFLRRNTKKEEHHTVLPIDLNKLQTIFLTPRAKGYLTTGFMDFARTNNIAILWIDSTGKVDASFIPYYYKRSLLIVKQAEARNNGKGLEIAKYIIKLKIESEDMKEFIPKLDKARDIKEVIQIEALSASHYFKQWEINNKWNWKGRHGKASGSKNAVDPINSLLNVGYSILAQKMSQILLKRGFETSLGFLHVNDDKAYFNMLTYDLIEPYRVLIDKQALNMTLRHRIEPTDFTFTEDKTRMIMKDKAFDVSIAV